MGTQSLFLLAFQESPMTLTRHLSGVAMTRSTSQRAANIGNLIRREFHMSTRESIRSQSPNGASPETLTVHFSGTIGGHTFSNLDNTGGLTTELSELPRLFQNTLVTPGSGGLAAHKKVARPLTLLPRRYRCRSP